MKKLAVNVDHIATLREARRTFEPAPLYAAYEAKIAGADAITVHLRMDRRHIQESDYIAIRKYVATRLVLESAIYEKNFQLIKEYPPDMITLVPERTEEVSTEGGLNVIDNFDLVRDAIKELRKNIREICVFIDPDINQIQLAKEAGADTIEIHTGHYAEAKTEEEIRAHIDKIERAIKFGSSIGLIVNAGHGINYENIKPLLKIRELNEFSIGHAIVSRAVFVGFRKAVEDMINLIRGY